MVSMLGAWISYVLPLAIILIVAAIAIVVVALRKTGILTESSPYEAKPALTSAERTFWRVLQQCLPEGYVLFAKVRLADIVSVKKGFDAETWQRHFNRISSKHVDFVLCDDTDMMPRIVIELDDSSHQRRKAFEKDKQKDEIVEVRDYGCFAFERNAHMTFADSIKL